MTARFVLGFLIGGAYASSWWQLTVNHGKDAAVIPSVATIVLLLLMASWIADQWESHD